MLCGEQRGHRLGACRATHARKHTRTQRKLREHLDMCHLPRGSHLVYTHVQEGGSSLPGCATFMLACAAGRGWRTEQTGESVQNQMTHFAGIKCLSKHGYCDLGQETRGNAHHRLPPPPTPPGQPYQVTHSCLIYPPNESECSPTVSRH